MDNFINGKFSFGKKWFCIGIAVGLFSLFPGLIYGIALILEKEYRKEGAIIIASSIIWKILLYVFILPILAKSDFFPFYIRLYLNPVF